MSKQDEDSNGIPLYKKDLIVREIKKHPRRSYRKIAEDLGTTHGYVLRIASEAKRSGLLDPNRRYGGLGAEPVRWEKKEEKGGM